MESPLRANIDTKRKVLLQRYSMTIGKHCINKTIIDF